jgi:hypothetical protein
MTLGGKAIDEYHSWLALRDIKTQKARLKKIHKTASKLTALLRAEEESEGLDWCSQWPKGLPPPSKVAKEIQRMIEESGVLEASRKKSYVRLRTPTLCLAVHSNGWLEGSCPKCLKISFDET